MMDKGPQIIVSAVRDVSSVIEGLQRAVDVVLNRNTLAVLLSSELETRRQCLIYPGKGRSAFGGAAFMTSGERTIMLLVVRLFAPGYNSPGGVYAPESVINLIGVQHGSLPGAVPLRYDRHRAQAEACLRLPTSELRRLPRANVVKL